MKMSHLKKVLFCALVLIPLMLLFFCSMPQKKIEYFEDEISSQLPFRPEWETRKLSRLEAQEVQQALSQPYRYLGSGGQCITFASWDDKYVIKFFKQKKFAPPDWIEHFPLPFLVSWLREKKVLKRAEKRNTVFSAFKLSFDSLSNETGLLYVHLNPTDYLKKTLRLCDPQGRNHLLDLDKLEFVVQRKAELAYTAIDSLIAAERMEEAKQAIDQLLTLQAAIHKKGFRNRDPNFRHNYGFVGNQVILIDVGRVVKTDHPLPHHFNTSRLRSYLDDHHPELLAYFDRSVDTVLNE
jgi:hypothetical protein